MRKLLLLCGLILVVTPVFAQQGVDDTTKEQQLAARMQTEWLTCHTNAECGLVAYNCTERFPANKNYLKEVQKEICKTELCSWMQCVPMYSFSAACEEGRCVTKFKPLKP